VSLEFFKFWGEVGANARNASQTKNEVEYLKEILPKGPGVKVLDWYGRFVTKDMRDLNFNGEFDAVINMWTSFGYLGDEGDMQFLRSALKALRPGGRFIMETGYSVESVLPTFRKRDVRVYSDVEVVVERDYDVETSTLHATWKAMGMSKVVSTRVYSYREILTMVRDTGFVEVDASSGMSENDFSLGDKSLLVSGVKPQGV
jgi:SAM-dependent methyltransferase